MATHVFEQGAYPESDPRFKIAAARRILYRNGLDSQLGGHVSLRVPGEEAFYISPSQYFDETMPGDILKVDFDLNILEQGALAPAAGFTFHANIYRARPDVNCVIHTHSRNVSAISTLGRVPEAFHSNGTLFQDDMVLFRDDINATPDVEGEQIVAAMGNGRALLIANHGVVHVGANIEETTAETLMFDFAAGVAMDAIAIGGSPFDPVTAQTYRALFLRLTYRRELWDAQYRRLKKSDAELFG